MSETIIRDNYFLFYSLVMGISVTVLYDLLRIFRRVVKHGDALISLEDLIYWVVVAISVFYMMHEENNGLESCSVKPTWASIRMRHTSARSTAISARRLL